LREAQLRKKLLGTLVESGFDLYINTLAMGMYDFSGNIGQQRVVGRKRQDWALLVPVIRFQARVPLRIQTT